MTRSELRLPFAMWLPYGTSQGFTWASVSFGSKGCISVVVALWDESVSACVWYSCTLPPCVFGQDVVGC